MVVYAANLGLVLVAHLMHVVTRRQPVPWDLPAGAGQMQGKVCSIQILQNHIQNFHSPFLKDTPEYSLNERLLYSTHSFITKKVGNPILRPHSMQSSFGGILHCLQQERQLTSRGQPSIVMAAVGCVVTLVFFSSLLHVQDLDSWIREQTVLR